LSDSVIECTSAENASHNSANELFITGKRYLNVNFYDTITD